MSRTTKIVLITVAILVILCVCVCAGSSIAMRAAGPLMQQFTSMTEDPHEVAQIAHNIVDYQLPRGYREQFGISMFGFDMVAFGPENFTDQMIMLMQFPQFAGLNQAEMEQQMRQSLKEQTGQQDINWQVVDQLDATIRDQRVTLTVQEGTDSKGTVYRQMVGVFGGKNGTAMLMIMAEKQHWDQRAVNAFLASLR